MRTNLGMKTEKDMTFTAAYDPLPDDVLDLLTDMEPQDIFVHDDFGNLLHGIGFMWPSKYEILDDVGADVEAEVSMEFVKPLEYVEWRIDCYPGSEENTRDIALLIKE